MFMVMVNGFLGDLLIVFKGIYVIVGNYIVYLYLCGYVYVIGFNLDDFIDFDCGFLNDDGDVDFEFQVWVYKKL